MMKNIVNLIDVFYKTAQALSAEDDVLEKEKAASKARQDAHSKIDTFAKTFIEGMLNNSINSAPEDADKIVVNFFSNVKMQGTMPSVKANITGNTDSVKLWAQNQFKSKQQEFVAGVNNILKSYKVTAPFDADVKVERVYE